MKKLYLLIISVIILLPIKLEADFCSEKMLLNGFEPLNSFGIDTTKNWWAITEPVEGNYRLHINGEQTRVFYRLTQPVFSPDGTRWASFAEDNVQRYLLTETGAEPLPGDDFGALSFSPDSRKLVYSYMEGGKEYIIHNGGKKQVYKRNGRIFVSWSGYRIAYTAQRGSREVLVIDDEETDLYDDIIPIGFWSDGQMLYCAKSGSYWQVYRGKEEVSQTYKKIIETKINLDGTVAAVLAEEFSGKQVSILISDEYYEPLVGRRYEWVGDLALHPIYPLIAYKAFHNGRYIVVYSSAEFEGGEETGPPRFTHDGSQMYFIGKNFHSFINIDGRKYDLKMDMSVGYPYAMKPKSGTIAYSDNSTLIIRLVDSMHMIAGKMLDYMQAPRYNWRTERYEALGAINNRLYMLMCEYED